FQQRRRLLELLVFEELPHQLLARIILPGLGLLGAGQQHLAFDLHERRRSDEEITGALHVDQFDEPKVFEKLLSDLGDGNIDDVYLVALDEIEQQIKRAAEGVEIDRVVHASWSVASYQWSVYPDLDHGPLVEGQPVGCDGHGAGDGQRRRRGRDALL